MRFTSNPNENLANLIGLAALGFLAAFLGVCWVGQEQGHAAVKLLYLVFYGLLLVWTFSTFLLKRWSRTDLSKLVPVFSRTVRFSSLLLVFLAAFPLLGVSRSAPAAGLPALSVKLVNDKDTPVAMNEQGTFYLLLPRGFEDDEAMMAGTVCVRQSEALKGLPRSIIVPANGSLIISVEIQEPEKFQTAFSRGVATMLLSLFPKEGERLDREEIPFSKEFFTSKRIVMPTK